VARLALAEAVKALHVIGGTAAPEEVPSVVDRFTAAFNLLASMYSREELSYTRAIATATSISPRGPTSRRPRRST